METLIENRLELQWAATRLVVDDPRKGLGRRASRDLLTTGLQDLIGRPRDTFDLVSAYFVPTRDGTNRFVDLASNGVAIRVLTNSLDATDVAAVHAGYAKRRRTLLNAGVRLFELRRAAPRLPRRERHRTGAFGSSSSSLHAKTFAVDAEKMFVGSFNFDPRSARLNTELGVVIDSPTLAHAVRETFNYEVPETAYEVVLDGKGRMVWSEVVDGRFVRHRHEPDASAWRRAMVVIMSVLPIEWLL
jgi:putative cardiolipin synthase